MFKRLQYHNVYETSKSDYIIYGRPLIACCSCGCIAVSEFLQLKGESALSERKTKRSPVEYLAVDYNLDSAF